MNEMTISNDYVHKHTHRHIYREAKQSKVREETKKNNNNCTDLTYQIHHKPYLVQLILSIFTFSSSDEFSLVFFLQFFFCLLALYHCSQLVCLITACSSLSFCPFLHIFLLFANSYYFKV